MDKLPICRICLVDNVRMYVVVNKNLRELYEKLTDNPFVTEDSRPILACFFCCTKLKQCCQFQRKCLEAEELFARMMSEDHESNPLINQDHPESSYGLFQTPIEHVSIVSGCQPESVDIDEELSAFCERPDDIVEPKEERQSDELALVNQENIFSDVEDIPVHYSSVSDSDDDEPLTEFKIEVEEHEVSRKKPKQDEITEEQKKHEQSDMKVIRTTESTFKTVMIFKEHLTDTKLGIHQFSLNTNYRNNTENRSEKSNKVIVSDFINRHRSRVKVKSFKCDVCPRSFEFNSQYTRHIRTHTGDKRFKCDVCLQSFKFKSHYRTHKRTHTGVKRFKCDVCLRCFNARNSLITHKRTHTGEKPYKCDVCQRSFYSKNYLRNHIPIHSGKKPFECDVCERAFINRGDLKKHMRIHTGEKPYKCYVCHSSFNIKGSLTKHIRIHTGEKPYKCYVCHSSFNIKGSLTKHIRIHTGEKPFKCDVCQLCFSHKSSLTNHIRIHTDEN